MNLFSAMLVAHLIGDFIFQNDAMQTKTRSSIVCTKHLLAYAGPFLPFGLAVDAPAWLVLSIWVEHWLQDRFSLHLKWMRFFGHTPPERWTVGPLCIDQAFHIAWIGILCASVPLW